MNLAIHGRSFKDDSLPFVNEMFKLLAKKGASLQVFEPYANFIKKKGISLPKIKTYDSHKQLSHADFVLSVGGDGTLLEAVTYVRKKEIPILGINTGRLGFLATTPR